MISQETIDAIRERANLVDIVSETVQLKRQGSNLSGLCPFHSEKTPSFHIRGDGSYYHCFGCGASGNIFSFLMQTRGLSFPEAVEELASRYNITVRKSGADKKAKGGVNRQIFFKLNDLAQHFFRSSLKAAEPAVLQYLRERRISAEALDKFGIGYAPKTWNSLVKFLQNQKIDDETLINSGLVRRSPSGDLYDVFRGRLIFPIWVDTKRIVAYGARLIPALWQDDDAKSAPKYLNSPETPIYQKNKTFFGGPQALEGLRDKDEVFLVEGYMDVVGLWQAGVKNSLATCGTAVTENHAKRLSRLVKRVNVLFDGDKAGRAAAARCFGIFANSGLDVSCLFLGEGEDPDSLALKHGKNTYQELLALKKETLLDAFIDGALERYSAADAEGLGAASKGKLCEEVLSQISLVKNAVEKAELLQQASRRLRVETGNLESLAASLTVRKPSVVGPGLSDLGPGRGATAESNQTNAASKKQFVPKKISELPAIDRQILTCVMVLKGELSSLVLRDPELCMGLDPLTLLFIDSFERIVSASYEQLEDKKERIRELLAQYGESWTLHWKTAYKMAQDEELSFKRMYEECKRTLAKTKLNQAVMELDSTLSSCRSDEERLLLAQEKLSLSKRLQSL